MNLGDILKMAAQKDLAAFEIKNGLIYREWKEDGCFKIKLSCKHEEAYVECSIPYTGIEDEENYARLYFLSMVFNESMWSMIKKNKYKRHKLKK